MLIFNVVSNVDLLCRFPMLFLSNDSGKVDSNFFCYAATVLSPHRNVPGVLLFISCVAVLAWPLKLFHCSFQKQRAFGNKLYLVFIFGVCK